MACLPLVSLKYDWCVVKAHDVNFLSLLEAQRYSRDSLYSTRAIIGKEFVLGALVYSEVHNRTSIDVISGGLLP